MSFTSMSTLRWSPASARSSSSSKPYVEHTLSRGSIHCHEGSYSVTRDHTVSRGSIYCHKRAYTVMREDTLSRGSIHCHKGVKGAYTVCREHWIISSFQLVLTRACVSTDPKPQNVPPPIDVPPIRSYFVSDSTWTRQTVEPRLSRTSRPKMTTAATFSTCCCISDRG